MRKFLIFPDGDKKELSPLTYDEFLLLEQWVGFSDRAFNDWKRANGYSEIEDFNDEALHGARVVCEPGEPRL